MEFMTDIEKKYEEIFLRQTTISPVFTHMAKQQMAELMEVMLRSRQHMEQLLATGQNAAIKGGYLAEEWHAGTFNMDAVLKEKSARAVTDRYKPEWEALGKGTNDTPADIVVTEDGRPVLQVQSKYNRSAEDSVTGSNSYSQVKNGRPKYEDSDVLLGPSDQVHPKDGSVSIAEHADAAASANSRRGGDPAKTKAYEDISKKIRSRVEKGDVASTELTKQEANELGEGNLKKLDKVESSYKTRSTLRQAGRAAAGAAALSAVVAGTVNVVRYASMAREGKISADEAVIKIMAETAAAAADSAVKAGSVVSAQSLLVRYGSEKVVIGTLARQGMSSLVRTNAVTVGVVCAIDAIKDLVALSQGRLTREQFYERQGKGMLTTTAGVTGGTLGAIAAQGAAITFSLPAMTVGGVALLPLIGGLAGGMIAGMAMQFAIDNGVERPYRELMQNADLLRESAQELERASLRIFQGQVLFTKMLEKDSELDRMFAVSMKRSEQTGEKIKNILEQL